MGVVADEGDVARQAGRVAERQGDQPASGQQAVGDRVDRADGDAAVLAGVLAAGGIHPFVEQRQRAAGGGQEGLAGAGDMSGRAASA